EAGFFQFRKRIKGTFLTITETKLLERIKQIVSVHKKSLPLNLSAGLWNMGFANFRVKRWNRRPARIGSGDVFLFSIPGGTTAPPKQKRAEAFASARFAK